MLSNELTLTWGTTPVVFKRANQDNFGSVFLNKGAIANTEFELIIRNSYEGVTNSPKPSNSLATVRRQMQRTIIDLKMTVFDADGYPSVIQAYTHVRSARGTASDAIAAIAKMLNDFVTTNRIALVSWEA